jgi:hypothetical protein
MPYSCCTIATSKPFITSTAAAALWAEPFHEVMHDLRRTPRQGLPGHGLVEDAHYADVITGSA